LSPEVLKFQSSASDMNPHPKDPRDPTRQR